MPTDACQYFYECEFCQALLKQNALMPSDDEQLELLI